MGWQYEKGLQKKMDVGVFMPSASEALGGEASNASPAAEGLHRVSKDCTRPAAGENAAAGLFRKKGEITPRQGLTPAAMPEVLHKIRQCFHRA
ncbi:hypothetical protein [Sodalis ligni]|uniref:Uncharacterized protein n=1 Tax=Sodalis ligni TaxID=2697027 RepID=A0A4R1NA23_9GAMM|nr:hypothetical protein [Sodalis ligni]TCL04235.1 hypothetical protein EZJ58_2347 [Sodalis ligni]